MPKSASHLPLAGEQELLQAVRRSENPRRVFRDRAVAFVCLFVGLGYLARLLKTVASRLQVNKIWDDSYMFVRYADNILKDGIVSWNPHGQPTYGLTSLLYMSVVLPMRVLFRHNAALAIECASLLCGALFLCLFVVLVFRSSNMTGRARTVIALGVLLPIAGYCYSLAGHFTSGMDTMFALAYLCAYFLVFHRYERLPSRAAAVTLAVLSGLAFSARPDLLIYTMTLPAALFLFAPARRRQTGLILLAGGALVLAQMGIYAVYFHSPLPLPFYVKGFHHYGGFPYEAYHAIAAHQLADYLHDTWFLFALIAVGFRHRLQEWTAMSRGLLVATLVSLIYFRYFAVQIMQFDQRFYYPTLPALGALAAYCLGLAWKAGSAAPRQCPCLAAPRPGSGGSGAGRRPAARRAADARRFARPGWQAALARFPGRRRVPCVS